MVPRMALVLDSTRVKEVENFSWKFLLLLIIVALFVLSSLFLGAYAGWGRFWSSMARLCF